MSDGSAFNCSFEGCSAKYGGALHSASADNCSFIDCSATKWGGALYRGPVRGSRFTHCSAKERGGALCDGSANDCSFIDCSALEMGGALHLSSADNCSFVRCSARDGGGAMSSGSAFNCSFVRCSALEMGGALYGCSAEKCTFIDCMCGSIQGHGGALCDGSAKDCNFIHCVAYLSGGAISSRDCSIDNCNFVNCVSNLVGGAISISDKYTSYIDHCNFTNFYAIEGIAIYNCYYVSNCIFNNIPANLTVEEIVHGSSEEDLLKKHNIFNFNEIKATLTLNKTTSGTDYYMGTVLTAQIVDSDNNEPIGNVLINFVSSNGEIGTAKTDAHGVARYIVPYAPGEYSIIASVGNAHIESNKTNPIIVSIKKAPATIATDNFSTTYNSGKTFHMNVTTENGPLSGIKLAVKVYTGTKYETYYLTTGSDGSAKFTAASKLSVGTHKVIISNNDSRIDAGPATASIVVEKVPATIDASKFSTTYDSGKVFYVKVTTDNGPLSGIKLAVKVYTGTKYKTYYLTTDSKGSAKFNDVSKLSVGTHKVVIGSDDSRITVKSATTSVAVKKAPTTVNAHPVKNKYKSSKYFKVTVKNKATKKVVSKLTIKIKVYTGKKYKTYSLKTNSKGVASLNTKSFAKGKHKVVISSSSKYYSVSKKGNFVIK